MAGYYNYLNNLGGLGCRGNVSSPIDLGDTSPKDRSLFLDAVSAKLTTWLEVNPSRKVIPLSFASPRSLSRKVANRNAAQVMLDRYEGITHQVETLDVLRDAVMNRNEAFRRGVMGLSAPPFVSLMSQDDDEWSAFHLAVEFGILPDAKTLQRGLRGGNPKGSTSGRKLDLSMVAASFNDGDYWCPLRDGYCSGAFAKAYNENHGYMPDSIQCIFDEWQPWKGDYLGCRKDPYWILSSFVGDVRQDVCYLPRPQVLLRHHRSTTKPIRVFEAADPVHWRLWYDEAGVLRWGPREEGDAYYIPPLQAIMEQEATLAQNNGEGSMQDESSGTATSLGTVAGCSTSCRADIVAALLKGRRSFTVEGVNFTTSKPAPRGGAIKIHPPSGPLFAGLQCYLVVRRRAGFPDELMNFDSFAQFVRGRKESVAERSRRVGLHELSSHFDSWRNGSSRGAAKPRGTNFDRWLSAVCRKINIKRARRLRPKTSSRPIDIRCKNSGPSLVGLIPSAQRRNEDVRRLTRNLREETESHLEREFDKDGRLVSVTLMSPVNVIPRAVLNVIRREFGKQKLVVGKDLLAGRKNKKVEVGSAKRCLLGRVEHTVFCKIRKTTGVKSSPVYSEKDKRCGCAFLPKDYF